MADLNPDDPKQSLDPTSQSVKVAAGTRQSIQVIKNQMINPFICEQKKGCIAYSEDLLSSREKGIEALAVVKTTEEECAVVSLNFVQDLVVDKKVEVIEADPSLDQGYTMSKGNKANYLAAIQTAFGSKNEMNRALGHLCAHID